MSRSAVLLRRLENASDRLSPIVVKEVRQVVRGREFASAFAAILLAGLGIAFVGATDALTGSGVSGRWTFAALTVCLALLGLVVVPLGAFNALRTERMEQTLELITVTALSPRRVVVGKLLSQVVKLATFFAVMAPFIAMSFLLGGVDFVTILLSLVVLFLWSTWVCALCLMLSTLLKSRAMSGAVFTIVAVGLFLLIGSILANTRMFSVSVAGPGASRELWLALGISTSFCLVSMINLVLLAEHRLSLPTDDKVTAVRLGFFAQFLLIVAWTLPFANDPPRVQSNALEALGVFGGLQLMLVAWFTVTEDMVASRRVLLRMQRPSRWSALLAVFRPGGGRGAAYVVLQMGILLGVALLFDPTPQKLRWLAAICGYICLFTGLPTAIFRRFRPTAPAALKLRIVLLALLPAALILPDLIYYLGWRPEVLNLSFGRRHLINPFVTLSNWHNVEVRGWQFGPYAFALLGVVAYAVLIHVGWNTPMRSPSVCADLTAPPEETASADAVH